VNEWREKKKWPCERSLLPGYWHYNPIVDWTPFPSQGRRELQHISIYKDHRTFKSHFARLVNLHTALEEWGRSNNELVFNVSLVDDQYWNIRGPLSPSMKTLLQTLAFGAADAECGARYGTTAKAFEHMETAPDTDSYWAGLHITWW
jgi:hypothetical protein